MVERRGRPRAGLKVGERATDYPSLMIRLPPDTKARLKALSTLRHEPIWRVLHDLLAAHVSGLSEAEHRWVSRMTRRILGEELG
jgi:hypothetical protein